MNYVLQVVRGRSAVSTLKLADGVNSIGRHDDCVIRVRSSQVSRRHCEVFETAGKLMVRDLGSANGTFVNGKRVADTQMLRPGDVLTLGDITLRVDSLGKSGEPAGQRPQASAAQNRPSGDTAELEAIPLAIEDDPDQEEFEVAIEDVSDADDLDIIPLQDDDGIPFAPPMSNQPAAKAANSPGKSPSPPKPSQQPKPEEKPEEDDAVAQFLMDLKLDDDE